MLTFLSPYMGWLKFGLATSAIVGVFVAGHHYAALQNEAATLKNIQEQRIATDLKDKQLAQFSSQLEVAKNAQTVITQTIQHNVDHYINRPVYGAACFDADGLADVNKALSGQISR
jgi:hypothetical protein